MKKIVHLMGFKPSICNVFAHFEFLRKIKILSNLKVFTNLTNAFSLVEMLMALLVASLLLAALAPVMTRRMADHELKVISEASNYDKDLVVSLFTKDTDFNIPSDANQVRITMMGGGGKGGDAFYGNKEFTSSQTFTVPDGVTKLRVFMVGAGGGGASGGMGNSVAYGNIPAIGSTTHTVTTAGTYIFPNVATVPDTHVAPALHSYCQKYGTTGKWIVKSDGTTQLAPGAKFPRIDSTATVNLTKFTACGAGGGGGYLGGGGGSGGYVTDRTLSTSTVASNITLKVGAAGGGGSLSTAGVGGIGGGTGGAGGGGKGNAPSGANGNGGNGQQAIGQPTVGGGGGGGGGTAILSGTTILAEIGGGGGGGGYTWFSVDYCNASPSCGGGGGGKGSGGGGGGTNICHSKTVGCILQSGKPGNSNGVGGLSGFAVGDRINNYPNNQGGNGYEGGGGGGGGAYVDSTYGVTTCASSSAKTAVSGSGGGGGGGQQGSVNAYAYGGGGGGGQNGAGGSGGPSGVGGTISTTFGANNCNGGNASTAGKPGAMKITYTVNSVPNGIQCNYYAPSNGGGGGGAGQVWIGEINVTPKQTINLKIGQGGAVQNIGAENGNDGENTSITIGSNTYSVSGGRGGKYESDSTYIVNTGGLGGGIKTSNFSSSAVYKDWLKLNEKVTGNLTGGTNGGQGYLEISTQNGAGGAGGNALKMDGSIMTGGAGGINTSEGVSASAENYGSGGGGGAGGADGNFGAGGKGANGYIYIEWGGSNGSGGTVGEFTKKTITNLDPDPTKRTMKIRIGRGGGITSSVAEDDSDLFTSSTIGSNGNGGETSISIISGGKTVKYEAKGGLKGNDGTMDMGVHGDETKIPSNFSDIYKEYVQGNMNIVLGQKGEDNYGGMGGYLSCLYQTKDDDGNSICTSTIKSNDGTNITLGPIRPGCGGTSIVSPLYDAICNAKSTTASPEGGVGILGAGGGGGAVLNQTGGKGGNGGNGFVILEYKSTTLD